MKIEHISVSRKGVFDQCHKKYQYQYDLGLVSTQEEPFYFTFGKIIHKVAEEFVRSKGDVTLDEVASNVLNGSVPLGPESLSSKVTATVNVFPSKISGSF